MGKASSALHSSSICLALLLGLGPARGIAQGARAERARSWPVDSVVARFDADMRRRVVNSMGNDVAFSILYLPPSFEARKDSLLDGLERLSMTSSDEFVRRSAAERIAFAGEGGSDWRAVPGVMRRLTRIYRSTEHSEVRLAILGRVPLQAERAAAAALLRSIAREPDEANDGTGPHGYFSYGDPRTEALARLSEMGQEGRAALQAMHRSGEVRSPQGRIWMEEFARRGFPVEDLREQLRP